MRRIYALLIALTAFSWHGATAQSNLQWEELGPNNMGTRVRALAVDGSGTVWAGAVGGGLWKSVDDGQTWDMVDGISDNLAVSAIHVNGNNIYVGTGELVSFEPTMSSLVSQVGWVPDSTTSYQHGVFQYAGMVGEGVFVSNDGGVTWTHNNGTWGPGSDRYNNPFISIQRINSNGNRVFIGTLDGLYYSDNADLSNLIKADGNDASFDEMPILDIEVSTNNIILVSTEDSLWRSTNNGATFGRGLNDSILPPSFLPGNQVGGARIEIAVAPSNPSIVYVCGVLGTNQSASGIWRSDDAGVNFTRIGPKESSTFQPLQGEGITTCILQVNPSDEDKIILGGARLYNYDPANGWTIIGSSSFTPGFSTNYVPSPMLALAFNPNDDSTYYVGTNKELVGTFDYGQSFSFRTRGLNAGTMQSIRAAPDYRIVASERYHGLLYKANGNSGQLSQQFTSIYPQNEGGLAQFSPTRPEVIFSQSTDGGIVRSLNNGSSWEIFYGFPIDSVNACFGTDSLFVDRPDTNTAGAALYDKNVPFVTPWVVDAVIAPADLQNDTNIQNTPAYIYLAGGAFVWVCSNPFGDLDSLPHWNRLTVDLTNAPSNNPEYLTAIAVSGDNSHTIIVGSNYGRLYRLANANDPGNIDCAALVRLDTFTANWPQRWISDIAFEKGNPDNVVVTFGGYDNFNSRVWLTNNALSSNQPTFTDVTGNLPANLPVYTAAIHPDANQTVIVIGTEKGAYVTDDNYNSTTNLSWTKTGGAEIGNAPVYDLYFRDYYITDFSSDDYAYGLDYTLFAATAGRGCFKTRTLVAKDQPTLVGTGIGMTLSPNPVSEISKVSIELPTPTEVSIQVFNITGTHIATLVKDKLAPGNYDFGFNSDNLPSGTYLFNAEFTNSNGRYFHTIKGVIAH